MICLLEFPLAWSVPFWPSAGIAVLCLVYLNGYGRLSGRRSAAVSNWRVACFIFGLATLWLAIASPLASLDDFLLTAHMAQHFVLMSVAPLLIVLGAPFVPLLRGLPAPALRIAARIFRFRAVHKISRVTLDPVFALIAMNAAYLVWHIPAVFEIALQSETWHNVEHVCFFSTSLAFWWVVMHRWPAREGAARWKIIPYLLAADLVNTVLSASLTFSGRVLYPTYANAPRVCRLDALSDQIAAGAGMWVLGSLVFLAIAASVLYRSLSGNASLSAQSIRLPSERRLGY
jgi:putative membrane protein